MKNTFNVNISSEFDPDLEQNYMIQPAQVDTLVR